MAGETQIALVREQTGDRQTDSVQEQRDRLAGILNACPFIRGRLISGLPQANGLLTDGIELAGSGTIDIQHKLGRPHVGWFVTRMVGLNAAVLVENVITGPLADTHIRLYNSGLTASFRLWIF